jgi:REP element-mobilizing transposase RayT
MPDHVHVLVTMPEGISLAAFVHDFKQRSGYELKKASGEAAWQVSYYDHILRREESVLDVARYIWDNPVKGGLAHHWLDYAYSGPRERLEEVLPRSAAPRPKRR